MIRVTILSENTAIRPGLVPEDGLSVLVETEKHRILMDSGWNDCFLDNAKVIGADVLAADTAILSHNHYDHGLSMPLFFDQRRDGKYRFYLSSDALWPVFHRRADGSLTSTSCGLTDGELVRRRVPHKYIESPIYHPFADEPNVALLSRFERRCAFEPMLSEFRQQRGGVLVRDEFYHELALALPARDGLVLLTGCAHSGVCNMVLAAEDRLAKPVIAVVGGTHLKASGEQRAMETIRFFNEHSSIRTAAVCHCTGAPALKLFAEHCRAYHPCGAGSVLEFD